MTMADDSALPSWITHSGGVLTVAPTSGSVMTSNPYSIKVVYTPTYGSNTPTYTAVDITVTCEVTSLSISNTPSDQAYTIFDKTSFIDLSGVTYTQSPSCDYTFSVSYTLATTDSVSYITTGGISSFPTVDVYSQSGSDAGTQTVTMSPTVNFGSGQG